MFRNVARFLIALICSFAVFLSAYSQLNYEKRYSIFQNYIVPTHDFGFAITGSNSNKLAIVRTDNRGNIKWAKEYSNGIKDEAYNIKITKDKGYIVTGHTQSNETNSDVLLLKTSENGNIEWAKSYGDKSRYEIGQCVEQTSDGGFIVGANAGTGQRQIYIVKTDAVGNNIWTKAYKFTDSDYCYSIKETSDGGFIVGGISNLSYSYYYRGYLLVFKLDKNGEIIWKKAFKGIDSKGNELKGAIKDILINENNEIVCGGFLVDQECTNMQGLLMKLGSDGSIINSGTYDNSQCRNAGFNSIDHKSGSGYIAVGGGFTAGCCMSFNVFKINENLGLEWGWSYKNLTISNNGNWNQIVKFANDGGYIVCGRTLLKLKSTGRISCSAGQSLTSSKPNILEVAFGKGRTTLENYPLPLSLNLTSASINTTKTNICEDTCTKCEAQFDFMVSDSIICKNRPVNFAAFSSSSDSTIKWFWKFQGASPSTSRIQNPRNIKFLGTGNFYVSLQVTASKGYDTTIFKTFHVGGVDLDIKDFNLCGKSDTMLDAGNPGANFHWGTGERSQRVKIKKPGQYSITVSSEGCEAHDTINIFSGEKPRLNLPDYTIICNGSDISLNSKGGAYKYLWSTGETLTTIFAYKPGKYSVTASNECGSFTDSTIVVIADTCNSGYYIPNSFSPNGDGIDDIFVVTIHDFTEFKMEIYNVFGKVIYNINDPYKYWDGNIDGKPVAVGTYYYIIYLKDQNGRAREFHGSMMLSR
jgi:gliding motility-associated-like protein